MPAYLNQMDALKAKLAGATVEPRRENPVERAVKEQSRALSDRLEMCVQAMERCAEAMSSSGSGGPEEWDAVVTQREGPHIKSVKFKRIR